MIRRACLTVALLALLPMTAAAQFENPSRAFHKSTAFPLDGRHLTVACESCHLDGVYQGTPTTCAACHWERRQDDVYKTRLGMECAQCHRTTTWSAATWDHAAATGVVLNASHRTVGCDGCHRDAQFAAASTQCIGCHQRDFDATREPNHVAAGFSTACESCHLPSDSTFRQARFDHNATFPLVGGHAAATCATCHTGAKYAGTPRDCVGCHRTDYERTATPNHLAAGFPTTCEVCHRPTDPSWNSVAFDHNPFLRLNGRHATLTCATCHVNNTYQGTPRDCVGCHRSDYDRTTSPNHAAAGFSTTCETCHRDSDPVWRTGSGAFDHNQFFTLVGPHTFQDCSACHKDGAFQGTPRTCIGCHVDDYNRTAAPSHIAAGFSTTCESCHDPNVLTWAGAVFDHNTVFPLAGRHAVAACATCHVGGLYAGTPTDCFSCHRTQYEATVTPNHAAAGFPTTCQNCHSFAAPDWKGAAFDHNAVFPLAGRHALAACDTCHVGGRYAGTPTTCVGCHLPQYQATRNPNHTSAGFPTTCESCHKFTDASWAQGVFAHTWFPITSGAHKIAVCADCHTNPNTYAVFTCTTCHTRSKTDNDHSQVSGYVYDSNACYACHPNGRSMPQPRASHLLARKNP